MSAAGKALWYIETHAGRPLALADIAAAAGLSPFHLSRLFHARTGTSVMRYLRGRRLSMAAQRLADGASWKRVAPTLNARPVALAFSSCASTADRLRAVGAWVELCAQAVEEIAATARVVNRMVVFIISAPERGS
jgi:AraC-like DNA-binding protein